MSFTTLAPLRTILLALTVIAIAGCASSAGASAGGGGTKVTSIPPEVRGVWDGRITLSTRTAQMADGRLIIGKEQLLIIDGLGKVRLTPREQVIEPANPQFMQAQRRVTVTFAARPIEGKLAVREVRVKSPFVWTTGQPEAKVTVEIDFEPPPGVDPRNVGGAGGEMWQPVPLAQAYGRGPRSPYFAYADWRSPNWNGPSAGGAGDSVRTRVTRLAQRLESFGQWKCLEGRTFTVSPGQVYEWEQPGNQWIGDRLYAICAHEDDTLAIRVGNKARGTPFHVLGAGTLLDYPALVLSPYLAGWSRHYFSFQHYSEDPDAVLEAEARGKPINVTLLVFGRSLGDRGPGFDFSSLPQ